MNLIPLLCTLLAVAACGGESDARPGSPLADTLVVSSDVELAELASAMLPELAARSGLELRDPVRLERRSRVELESYLAMKLDEELPEERARNLTAVYSLLGLMPGDTDLRALLMSVYREQVAGFYDPDSTALFVMEDQAPDALEPVLLHELVHAVQDQWTELDAATDPDRGNDRATAAQAAIEGHATLVMLEYITERMQGRDVDLTEIPGFGAQMRTVLATARDQYPELARAPRIIQEGMLFPYIEGAGFVLAVWRERGSREGGLDPLLPASTEQVTEPARFLSDPPDDPTPLVLRSSRGEVLMEDGLGALEVRIFLEELMGEAAGAAAEGWDGDRYVLVEGPEGEISLTWASVWDDAGARDRFVETLRPGLAGLPAPATLEVRDLGGRAGAVLVVGSAPEMEVSVSASDGS